MSRTRPSRIRRHTPLGRRARAAAYLGTATLTLTLTACGSAAGDAGADLGGAENATISVNLKGERAKPGERVEVKLAAGRLADVRVGDDKDGELTGRIAKSGRTWTSDRVASPGTAYTVTAKDDRGRTAKRTFATEAAGRVNKLTLAPGNRTTVGVAQPLSIVFDNPVKNKKDVERHLKVTTSNGTEGTEGSWGWITDYSGKDRVDWRPKEYWKPGTEVKLAADLDGVNSGTGGGWFVRDYDTSFTIGRSQQVTVDLDSKRLTLAQDGKAVRSVPMSAGTPGGDKASWGGVNVLMAKEGTIRMNSETVGLGDAYDKMVDHSMRLTWSGMYAHAAPWNASYFGNTNHSSGCVGMSDGDAGWLYAAAQVGDPFVTKGSGHKGTADVGNGYGLWNLSWDEWQAKSALHGGGESQ
ncbi:L,D-transpeptidase [Streptomyces boluensis]|uniref:L,D-transpeptidase n=1 Tax=Streptomyces boluensis TaxID=1775135 RepID=UPI001FE98C4C|nr:Ig-like domain-containing protein [Streptomyces boluensis]